MLGHEFFFKKLIFVCYCFVAKIYNSFNIITIIIIKSRDLRNKEFSGCGCLYLKEKGTKKAFLLFLFVLGRNIFLTYMFLKFFKKNKSQFK